MNEGTSATIVVNGRFAPHTVALAAGVPHRLVFRREETGACSDRVVFPTLGLSVALAPLDDTAVELPALTPGSHPMTCQRGALFGRIVAHRGR